MPTPERQLSVEEARTELASCVLGSSWVYCTGARARACGARAARDARSRRRIRG
jgi:hypothetical protein